MESSGNRGKINPLWAAMKGNHPTWGTAEDCRRNWRKVFYIDGVRHGKKEAKASRRYSKDTIRKMNLPE